jgi:hypothetical protein
MKTKSKAELAYTEALKSLIPGLARLSAAAHAVTDEQRDDFRDIDRINRNG